MHPGYLQAHASSMKAIGAAIGYMKLLNVPHGFLLNLHEPRFTDGVVRPILPGADKP